MSHNSTPHYVNGKWQSGSGEVFASLNPATGAEIWQGEAAGIVEVNAAVKAAKASFGMWSLLSFDERLAYVERFKKLVENNRDALARAIAEETGKILWDSEGEVSAVIAKIDISVAAYHDRTGESFEDKGSFNQELRHNPLGVMAVFGPYNFPVHLPNGHIIPALLAGNTIVLKPSEDTPYVAEMMVRFWQEAGIPEGVINLVQGGSEVGIALVDNPDIAGVLFTGSHATGQKIHQSLAGRTEVMLALEMGGNNPLIVHEVGDVEAAATLIVQSAYITSGQRCTCARRLIIVEGEEGDAIIAALISRIGDITIGAAFDEPAPFMGPVINNSTAKTLKNAYDELVAGGGKPLVKMSLINNGLSYVSPSLVEVTNIKNRADSEYFGPLLQVIRVADIDEAIEEANKTKFGLSAGLISDNKQLWKHFRTHIRAGLVNWNRALTGASSSAPFGGPGLSGNFRPGAYYAADYCAYPVASITNDKVTAQENVVGLK